MKKGAAVGCFILFCGIGMVRAEESTSRSTSTGVFTEEQARKGAWPAPGSADTELGVLMELEVSHGKAEVYPRVQA